MGNVHMEARDINYRGGQKKMSVEEALKNTSGEAAAIAQLQSDVANLSDVKANLITIAPVFSAETAYDPGDLVYHNGLTYRCVNSHEGEWDADDFAATTISNELSSLMSGLTGKQNIYGAAVKIGEIADSDTVGSAAATKDGYISLVYEMLATERSISGRIRDNNIPQIGASFNITAIAYACEPICTIPCRNGQTYVIQVVSGHGGISIYQL